MGSKGKQVHLWCEPFVASRPGNGRSQRDSLTKIVYFGLTCFKIELNATNSVSKEKERFFW
jgi:hypothetical protein